MKPNLVVFDFCETLVNFQTADGFVEFVLANSKKSWRHFYNYKIIEGLRKTKVIGICYKFFPKGNVEKRLKAFALKGYKKDILHVLGYNYFVTKINARYNQNILQLLRNHKDKNDIIVISSGGYDTYLGEFCDAEQIQFLNCTKIEFKKNKCTGFFDGKDCMFEEKVIQIQRLIRENHFDFEKKIVYSDSITDMPLFKWADIAFVVSPKKQVWPEQNGFKQIIV